jgi:transposase InsO family protein
VLGLSARTVQRWQGGGPEAVDGRALRHHDAVHELSTDERAELSAVANSVEFAHLPPSQIVPRLADQGRYIASESTFYRVLRGEKQLAHRHSERPGRARSKPRAVCADRPNQLFSWDITYLPTTVRGQSLYLYLFMDVFSRMVVGWQVYAEESSAQASELLKDLWAREAIKPGQVILHSDNVGPMKGATMLATLQALGVMPSLSRPGVDNDNRKRLRRAVVDLCTDARDDVASVSSSCTGTRGQSMNFGLGKKAHRFAATFHGSNSSTRLIG